MSRRVLVALRSPGLLWFAVVVLHAAAIAVPFRFFAWAAGATAGMIYVWIVDAFFDRGDS